MDEHRTNLDIEFRRYLRIMRPYLGRLLDQDIIDICNAWIQRLSSCYESEKKARNKYISALCYQLARGMLSEPFLKSPPEDKLPFINDEFDSECSTEVEYTVIDAKDHTTKLLYRNKKHVVSETELLSLENEQDEDGKECGHCESQSFTFDLKSRPSRKQHILCYTCPKVVVQQARLYKDETDLNQNPADDGYQFRATNLIMKLREIKRQNLLLNNELHALKEESKVPVMEGDDFSEGPAIKSINATNTCSHCDRSESCKSVKHKIAEEKERTSYLNSKIESLQQQLNYYNDVKRQDIEDLIAQQKLEIIKVKANMREECQKIAEDNINKLKQDYENKITDIKQTQEREIDTLNKTYEEKLREKEKEVGRKDLEILNLRNQMVDQGVNLKTIISKILEKPNENISTENEKLKAQELEKRLTKMEKSKAKCTKFYESKLVCLQKEKHLIECSMQLHLIKQRAQILNEITDENQAEVTAALDKLETKYKEIVANAQTAAVQRRMQDQAALEAILQAAFGPNADVFSNNTTPSHLPTKTTTAKRDSQEYDMEMISALLRQQLFKSKQATPDKSQDLDSEPPGYCLDGERLGELFQKVYIPQRDTGDCLNK